MLDLCQEIQRQSSLTSGCIALMSPGRDPLSYESLWTQVEILSSALIKMGIERGDAVALAMPDNPETLVVFLAVIQVAVCAPLNPNLRQAECESSLVKLGARLLIVQNGMASDAVIAATQLAIPVLEIFPITDAPAGSLFLGNLMESGSPARQCYDQDTAILLFTSATTGRPKLVPLTHAQLYGMVESMRIAVPESDEGRVLILTPHFHLQCILSVLIQFLSGGSVISTPGFSAEHFKEWMKEFSPTQFAANPTLLRAILSVCAAEDSPGCFGSLRFVSCAGAPLPENLRDDLWNRLGVPVIEGYGLTEVGRVTMTPRERSEHRPGSVGRSYGIEIGIMDEQYRFHPAGYVGEIVLRGPNVIKGYANDPEANDSAFKNGWFRTGDLGKLDADGFLYIVGRIKESINRGSEKILPYEIEEVLSRHPAVREVAVFGYPHPRLGEEIGACIVLSSAAKIPELRHFVSQHLAPFKVPRLVVFVEAIPKGPTGKPQRAKLAELLNVNLVNQEENTAEQVPLDAIEIRIAEIWSELLNLNEIGKTDDFFLLGGDSLLIVEMLLLIKREWDCEIRPETLIGSATLWNLADSVKQAQMKSAKLRTSSTGSSCLVILQSSGIGQPLFLAHPQSGNLLSYSHLVRHLGDQRPIFGFQAVGQQAGVIPDPTFKAMAKRYVQAMQAVQASGPYWLAGYSMGGLIALEMARLLTFAGDLIGGVILLDTWCMRVDPPTLSHRIQFHIKKLKNLSWKNRIEYIPVKTTLLLIRLLHRYYKKYRLRPVIGEPDRTGRSEIGRQDLSSASFQAIEQKARDTFQLKPLRVRTLLLWCQHDDTPIFRSRIKKKWVKLVAEGLTIREIPGTHSSIMTEPHVKQIAAGISQFITQHSEEGNS